MTVQELIDKLNKLTAEEKENEVYIGILGVGLYLTTGKIDVINSGVIIRTKEYGK